MLGLSGEHLLILGIVLLFFGPSRLPALGGTFGTAVRNFRNGLAGGTSAKGENEGGAR